MQGLECIRDDKYESMSQNKKREIFEKLDRFRDTLNTTYSKKIVKIEEFLNKLIEKELFAFDIELNGKYLYIVFTKNHPKATISKESIDMFHISNSLDIDLIIKNCLACNVDESKCKNENCMKLVIY
jgi:hypothetical protein